MTLEKQFEEELLQKYEEAEEKCGYKATRFIQNISKFGGVKTVKEILRKGRLSDGFEKLQEAGLLALTMEATAIEQKYATLFDDEEVNACYELLCEYGYY